MIVSKKRVSLEMEKKIALAFITSTDFCKRIEPFFKFDYLQSPYIRKVCQWAIEYYNEFGEAISKHIQDVFEGKGPTLKNDEAELISELLGHLSVRWVSSGINVDYVISEAQKHFTKIDLQKRAEAILSLVDQDKPEEAEEQITTFKKVAIEKTEWINPSDIKEIEENFHVDTQPFLTLPGELGKFIGPIEREFFIAIAGKFKGGKTWALQEIALAGILDSKKVAVFSLEMPKIKTKERWFKRITGADKEGGPTIYPCFDCQDNQDGSCINPNRTNKERLLSNLGGKPPFDSKSPYRPCTYCREHDPFHYKIETWFEVITRPEFSVNTVRRVIKALPDLLRIRVYPRFSANISQIERDLDYLDYTEKFIPDIIIIDYADILAPESKNRNKIEQIDETWMTLAKLGGIRKAVIFTVTQVTREAIKKSNLEAGDMAGWIGKLAHVDKMLTLDQTPLEKRNGVLRVGKAVDRYEPANDDTYCWVLQKLSHGQAHLDSQIERGTWL